MLKQKILKIKKFALDVIFPPCCLGCGKNLEDESIANTNEFESEFHESFLNEHPYVCDECFKSIPINNALYCPICFTRFAGAKLCNHAKKSNLSELGFAANYENELIKNIIWNLKYRFVRDLSETLALILYKYLLSVKIKNLASYCIIPVPLHKSRLKWRGFNQSELIAEKLSEKLNIPLISDTLVRLKKTDDQTKLDKEKRGLNLQNAFQIKNPDLISGKNIFLLDDVYTSGATIEEAAKTLKQTGAKKIIGLVVAKG